MVEISTNCDQNKEIEIPKGNQIWLIVAPGGYVMTIRADSLGNFWWTKEHCSDFRIERYNNETSRI